jgi:hypothetical protein
VSCRAETAVWEEGDHEISLSLCLSFLTSPSAPFLICLVTHMGSPYVLMSKSDHLHDLECVCSWFSSFLFCRSCTQASLFVYQVSSVVFCYGAEKSSLAFLSINNAYGFLTRFVSLAYVCCLLVYRKRIHSAPLLHFPSPLEPSRHRGDINADVLTPKANASGRSNTAIDANNTTDIDVSATVSRRDF